MMGTKSSWATLATLCGSVTPSYRRTATYIALAHLLREGGTLRPRLKFDQRVQCEGVEGLAQLPRIPILGTRVNRAGRRGRLGLGRPLLQQWSELARAGSLFTYLLGDCRGCRGRRHFGGDRSGLLCPVHAALEVVAQPDGTERDTNNDQDPIVPNQIEVHQHRVGRYGERC